MESKREYLKDAKDEFIALVDRMFKERVIDHYATKPYYVEEPDAETIANDSYANRDDRMDYHEWCRVRMYEPIDEDKFYKMRNELMDKWHVAFDMGGCRDYTDWELDWSFRTCVDDDQLVKYFSDIKVVDKMVEKIKED